jgi:hypothetical protein
MARVGSHPNLPPHPAEAVPQLQAMVLPAGEAFGSELYRTIRSGMRLAEERYGVMALSKGEMIEKLEKALELSPSAAWQVALIREVIASLREYGQLKPEFEPGWFLEGE